MKPINAEEIVRVFNGWLEEADSLAEREAIECCIPGNAQRPRA